MSDTTTTTSTATTATDTYLDSLEEYFGVEMTLEDFLDIDNPDAFFAQLILDAEVAGTEIDFSAFESHLEDEIKELHAYLYTQAVELQAIIDASNSTISERAQAELLLEEIQELDALADDDADNYLIDAFDDGQTLSAELSQTMTEGESVTISPDDPQNGQNYTVTIENADDGSSGSSMNSEENANWVDLDGDGYKETNWDTNKNGVLDEDEANTRAVSDFDHDGTVETLGEEAAGRGDKDGDGVITAADLTHTGNTATTVTIDLEEGDTLELSSWDESTLTAMYKVTQEDGTVYYITLKNVTEDTKIICDTIPTNLDSMPDYISSKSWEFTGSQYSYYYFQTDHDHTEYAAANASNDTSKAYIYLDENTGNTATITPSPSDFVAETTYDVYCDPYNADTINLNFDDDTDLEFSIANLDKNNGSFTLTITAKDANGNTIITTLHNVSFNDRINIMGGSISSDQDGTLNDPIFYGCDSYTKDDGEEVITSYFICLNDMIYHNGSAYSGRSDSEISDDIAWLEAY